MTYSKGPWIYDAESGEIHTKDRTGFWGPDHEPVVVATVEQLDGVSNGDLLAASAELLESLDECYSLAIGLAAAYQFNNGLAEIHPRHAGILEKAGRLLVRLGVTK